jgi:sucrose phosphorylase
VLNERTLFEQLGDATSSFHQTARKYFALLEKRIAAPAFHPNSGQRVLRGNDAVFSLLRATPDGTRRVLALTNVTDRQQDVKFSTSELAAPASAWRDLLSDARFEIEQNTLTARLAPYQVLWLQPEY